MQVNGQSYLLPTDFKAPNTRSKLKKIYKKAMGKNEILNQVYGRADLTIAIFDACREIPKIEEITRSSGLSHSAYRGFGRLKSSGKNRIIAYSGASGELVDDGEGKHSPYTTMLLKHIGQKGFRCGSNFSEQRIQIWPAVQWTEP
jgi:uncharacterized caspase-like protein